MAHIASAVAVWGMLTQLEKGHLRLEGSVLCLKGSRNLFRAFEICGRSVNQISARQAVFSSEWWATG